MVFFFYVFDWIDLQLVRCAIDRTNANELDVSASRYYDSAAEIPAQLSSEFVCDSLIYDVSKRPIMELAPALLTRFIVLCCVDVI